ncbi:NeuD/PglB/VioB family sugar acetyltransferase [Candidatus Zixiibacteriota bacterium]
MKPLVLFGATHFGEVIAQLFRDINESQQQWDILGFLDDDQRKWHSNHLELPVLGGIDWLKDSAPGETHTAISIGRPPYRRQVAERLDEFDVTWATGVHPSVIAGPSTSFGDGSLVMAGCLITNSVTVGNHVIMNPGTIVGHHTRIGDFSTINAGVKIAGDVELGVGTYVGIGAAISDKLKIGKGAIIGGGTMVIESVDSFVTAVGVPAKVIKQRENDFD